MEGKVCLVTGASAGIGRAIALELLRAGHTVYGAARRVPKMDELVAAGGRALAMDARDGGQLDHAVAAVVEEQERIDVLVNNAGTVLHGSIEEVPLEAARDVFEVNVIAPARLTQLVLPHMRSRGSGLIVNVSSIGGEIALPLGAWYYASKHALEAFSDTLRMEVARFGIDVVIVQPGIIATGFEDDTPAQLRAYSGDGPYGPMAEAMARKSEEGIEEASSPEVVAAAVREAVEAERPATRYAVGWLAEKLLGLNRELPDLDWDAIATRTLLPVRFEEGGVQGEAGTEGQGHDRSGRGPGREDLAQDEQHRPRGAVAVLGEHFAGGRQRGRVGGRGSPLRLRGCGGRPGGRPSRGRRCRSWPWRPSRSFRSGPTCSARASGTSGDRPMRKPRSVMSQVIWSLRPVSVREAMSATRRPGAGPSSGCRTSAAAASREQGVGDHLPGVDRGGLDVERGEFEAEHHGRAPWTST